MRWIGLGALLLACGMAQGASAATEKFSVIASGEVVGALEADRRSDEIAITYRVSENGRGPKLSEQLRIDGNGLPLEWKIEGTTAFGGAVAESFSRRGGRSTWTSQADHGESTQSDRALYIANDASPWSYGLYARALLRARDGTLNVLPAGQLKIQKLRELRIGDTPVVAYGLTGVNLIPDLILLDESQRLFARIDSSTVLVRAGYEDRANSLLSLGRDLHFERLQRLQQRAAHAYEQPLRINNVRVFDPVAEKLTDPVNVVLFRGVIASVRPSGEESSPQTGEILIDGAGATLVPGLHDMHSHSSAWSGVMYLAAGVTNVRDMGNDNTQLLRLDAKIAGGELPGPRIYRAGFIEGRSPYSSRNGFIPDSIPEALNDVRWYADHGYRQIKIYNSMTPDWIAPIAQEAHRLGLRVSGHVPAFVTPDRAIHDGYDEINHINQLVLGWLLQPNEDTRTPLRLTALGERAGDLDVTSPRVRATVDLMKSHATALDTTIVTLERLMLSRAGQVQAGDAPYLDHVPIGYQRYRRRSFVNFKSAEHQQRYEKSFQRLLDVIHMLDGAGIRLLPGTDDGTGFTVHRELELYVRSGMSPARALAMGTLGCARYLGEDQTLGSIVPGKRADFFLIDGDPTRDISTIRRARLVVKDDRYYFPAELYDELGITPFGAPPAVSVAP